MFLQRLAFLFIIAVFFSTAILFAGPYNEIGVNGYIGPDFKHANPLTDPCAIVNPIFRGWATSYRNYSPSDSGDDWFPVGEGYDNPDDVTGPATGDVNDIVCLGDIATGETSDAGEITLIFGDPELTSNPNHIRDVNGYDFVVFENGFISTSDPNAGSVTGQMFAELAYVEVSSDGNNFVRFDSVSLTPEPVGYYGYLTLDITGLFNLAGKHPNKGGVCTGTGFDLANLAGHPDVLSGLVDLDEICFVKLVDICGVGNLFDSAMDFTNPATYPSWSNYLSDNRIYDAWLTFGSGGFDLEAIGVLRDQNYQADLNLDGLVDTEDLHIFCSTWLSHFGQPNYIDKSDMAQPKNLIINFADFAIFANQWQKRELWRPDPQ